MNSPYTATAYRIPGRNNFAIKFRHPMKTESGRSGRQVCKGLGTDNEKEAKLLEQKMKDLLAKTEFHSVGARDEAARQFGDLIAEIFYSGLDPSGTNHRAIRRELLPLDEEERYAKTLLLGITGSGKTTLLRRLIGSDPERDRFPSTSVNRTTTCEIEVITGADDFSVAITFLSRHQTQQEVIESLSNAALKAIEGGSEQAVATELFEQSDLRFRLKYILGAWDTDSSDEEDAFAFGDAESPAHGKRRAGGQSEVMKTAVHRIQSIAAAARKQVEKSRGAFASLGGGALDDVIDEAHSLATETDEFLDLVNELMEEIARRFVGIGRVKPVKSSTGWWDACTVSMPANERDEFIKIVRSFCGTAKDQWGSLLTPLVTGIRVRGPFRPAWVPDGEDYRHVFIDTEGLLHARMTADVPDELTSLFSEVDNVLLVESAKNALHSPAAGKVFEAVSSTGHIAKFALLFTHMDTVSGDNLTTAASKREHVFGGVRNILDNQVAKTVSRDSARRLAEQLETNTFYFAYLDSNRYPTSDPDKVSHFESRLGSEFGRLVEHLAARQALKLQPALPKYSFERFGIAVREASLLFQDEWDARLGYRRVEGFDTAKWQSIKAMARRLAEGWFDGYKLWPVGTLTAKTRNVLTRFLEAPLDWVEPPGKVLSDDEKTAIIDRIKEKVDMLLKELSSSRLWKTPQARWQEAYQRPIGVSGGTGIRRHLVHQIFGLQVPVPEVSSDRWTDEWISEIKNIVERAIEIVKEEQNLRKKPARA